MATKQIILDDKQRERVLTDTGETARELLGFNYDRDEMTGEILQQGGIYKHGPHQQMVEFLDDREHHFKQLVTPRRSRKTTLIISWMVRQILANPDIRILYAMQTCREAKRTVQAVKAILESENVKDNFGDQKGSNWTNEAFTVGTRRDTALRDPTMMAGGLDRTVTGSHPDIIVLDDLIDWTNVRNPDQIEKAITYLKLCFPLLESGGYLLDVGTPYDEADVHHHIRRELGHQFECMWIDCGMEIVSSGAGGFELMGEPKFPHLTENFLKSELGRMSTTEFSANYCLECLSAEDQLFFRDHFRTTGFENWMTSLSGYVLTDTATTDEDHGSLSVVAVVLLSHDDVAYLADLRVGLWQPQEFVETFLRTVHKWRSQCRLHGQVFEMIGLNRVYRSVIEQQARAMQIPLNLIGVSRGTAQNSKRQRIRALQPRMAGGRFVVLDTVPKSCIIRGKEKTLFSKNGYRTKDGELLPDGMLVDQFIRPNSKRKDIPDAIADIEAVDKSGQRICIPSAPPRWVTSTNAPTSRRQNGSFWSSRPTAKNGWRDLARRGGGRHG